MEKLQRLDRFLSDKILWFTIASLLLGIFFCKPFSVLVPFTPAIFAAMTFINTLGCSFRQIGHVATHPVPVLVILVLLHLVVPALCLGLCTPLFPDNPLFITGLVLNFVLPTGVVSLMWVTIGRGNLPLCLSALLLDTLLSPIMVPLSMKLLVGSMVVMDASGMMKDLLFMVALPATLALLCHRIRGGQFAQHWKPRLSPFAKLLMFLIIVSNATSVAPFLKSVSPTLLAVIAVLVGLSVFSYFLGWFVSHRLMRLDFPSVQTVTIVTGARNISAGAVLAAQYFPPDVLFPVAFAPIFTQIMLAVTVKFLRRTKAGQADQAAWEAESASVPQ
ncbi:bile acid:sodium symporter family protein [Oscillibacter sp.]|uniref:bile acid:sodium symporter family protein n=1 Tax=Oscillibacter sp. TaxID=1945593 RepID=UPI0028A1A0B9|nr:bile acid:sodium symporter family protein [Oscillibacter sp.]